MIPDQAGGPGRADAASPPEGRDRCPDAPLLAEVTRRDVRTVGERVESAHAVHLVVCSPDGEVVVSAGDPQHATYIRSAAKPFQATACLELLDAAGDDALQPGGRELAVAWASHRGEARHLEAVTQLLRRSSTSAETLTCPAAVAEADPGASPSRLQHNCSGKHALFALAGRSLQVTGATLLDPDGPLQRHVLALTEVELGPPLAVGVDGCGAPAVAVPLDRLAAGFARVAVAGRFRRVREAGLAYPGLVGGEGRLESALLAAGVVAKVGAEGVFGVGWLDARGRPWGLAVKAVDGAARGAAAVTAELLAAAAIVPSATWTSPPPLGGGAPAGSIRVTAQVRALGGTMAGAGLGRTSR